MLFRSDTGWRKIWFPKVRVVVGEPQMLNLPNDMRGKVRREEARLRLRDIMEGNRFKALHRHQNVLEAVYEASVIHGCKATIFQDVLEAKLSYGKLWIGSALIDRLLHRRVSKGENVGLLLPTTAASAVVLLAMWRAQTVPAILNPTVGASAMKSCLEVAQVRTVITSRQFIEKAKLQEFITELKAGGTRFIWLEDLKANVSLAAKIGAVLHKNRIAPEIGRATPAVILFTSGTEGTPKGVVLTHGNLLANVAQLRTRVDIGPKDIIVSALPIFHSFGLLAGVVMPMICGIRTGMHPSPLHYRVIPELAYNIRATIVFGTDTFLAGWAKRAAPEDFATVRAAIGGAEPVKESTRSLWSEKFGVRVLEGYGATECSPVLSLNTPSEPEHGNVGRLLPAMEYRLEPVAGIDGQRLLVRGPNVMAGYLRADAPGYVTPPDAGWYDTGDAVNVDELGRIKIVGRLKRFAKIAGEMISLQNVEQVAQSVYQGVPVAAIATPDEKTGQRTVLYVQLPEANRADLIAYGKANGIPPISLASEVRSIDVIPLLASGKTNYPEVERIFNASR